MVWATIIWRYGWISEAIPELKYIFYVNWAWLEDVPENGDVKALWQLRCNPHRVIKIWRAIQWSSRRSAIQGYNKIKSNPRINDGWGDRIPPTTTLACWWWGKWWRGQASQVNSKIYNEDVPGYSIFVFFRWKTSLVPWGVDIPGILDPDCCYFCTNVRS